MNSSMLQFFTVFGSVVLAAADAAPVESSAKARDEIAALRREISRSDIAYHRDAAPLTSDYNYDQLRQRLAKLEHDHPAAAAQAAPLAAIGDDRTGTFRTQRHRERMLSLDKTYAEADLRGFHSRLVKIAGSDDLGYVVEPKIDGLAVSVTYERGKFVRAVTRGNGTEGDDVTANVRMISTVLPTLIGTEWPEVIEVRGEVYVPWAEFMRVNAERDDAGEPRFANPRNLAAGTLRQLDPQAVVRRGLQIVFFGIGACEPISALPAKQSDLSTHFRSWGLPAIEPRWTARNLDEMVSAVAACGRGRSGFSFPTDGAVVKLDSLALQREVGAADSAPRWAVAFKFAPERAETQVLAITVQVGRTGVLTPVAELAPVALAGSTVARATLHNRDEIARKDVRVGDTVYVEKAGDIIPAIVGVNLTRRPADARTYSFPTTCPKCNADVVARSAEAAVRCTNAACSGQLRRRIEHFAGKACVDIAGLGPAMVDLLVQRGLVSSVADIFLLQRADLLTLGRNVEKSADQLLASVEKAKAAELWRYILGLGIPQVGAVGARDLARRFGSLDALASISSHEAEVADLATRAAKLYFSEAKNRGLVADLIAAGVRPTAAAALAGTPLTGKTFVLTGTLPTLTRAQVAAKIEAAGGKIALAVTRATTYVVVGADAGSKLEQARTLGVPLIDETMLRRMLAEEE